MQTQEQKREKLEANCEGVYVQTPKSKMKLLDAIDGAGVKERLKYYNKVEVKTGSVESPFKVIDKINDYGLVFHDGFQIKNVSYKIFRYIDAPIRMVRERNGIILKDNG